MVTNISNELVWQITRNQNSYLVQRNTGGGAQFSRDPLNLVNKHSYKYAGYANNKAIGVQGTENGVAVTTKNPNTVQKPAKTFITVNYGPSSSNRKIFKGVADKTAVANNKTQKGYRADLREEAIARVSAVRRSQRPKKDAPAKKLRGSKARKAAEASE